MHIHPVSLAVLLAATGGLAGCGSTSSGARAVPTVTTPPGSTTTTYPTIVLLKPTSLLTGVSVNHAIDYGQNKFTPSASGSTAGQVTGGSSGIASISLNVTNVGGVSFSETFVAADLSPVPGFTPPLLSGSKTPSSGSVRTLTLLDVAASNLDHTVLGAWEYAPTVGASNTVASWFVFGPATRVSDIPLSGTADYSGLMVGRYADGAEVWRVTASASATADFANRSLAFGTTGTMLAGSPRPDLDFDKSMSTLTYAAGTNNMTGSLTGPTLSGSAAAKFYGPAAAEVAGTFFAQDGVNSAQMVGSFGLKKQ
jgi:hypothetical protein